MTYLVDTNVLCESTKKNPDPKVLQWLADHDAEIAISIITFGEMSKAIYLLDHGKRRQQLEDWWQRMERWASGRILTLDIEVMRKWAAFCAIHQRNGRTFPAMDSLIAATAIHYELTLVTRNVEDFPDDVALFNPWQT